MLPAPLQKKLRILPGVRLLLLNAPEEYRKVLGTLPDDTVLHESPDGTYGVVHLFVRNQKELAEWAPRAFEAVQPRGVLWISYPKKSGSIESDLTRDVGWEPVYQNGWKGVTQVSIDEDWSALRFRPLDEVGT